MVCRLSSLAPQDVWKVYEGLNPISPMFTIAAAFGNVHGVYKESAKHRGEMS